MRFGLLVLSLLITFSFQAFAQDSTSTFERVVSTQTLKCGYIIYPPELSKDPNTGKLSGIVYDVIEEIGKQTGIKIDWSEEVGIAEAFDGLYSKRYDVVCASYFENPPRATRVIFTNPLNYTASFAYARIDDNRFGDDFSVINSPNIKIAVIDGEASEFIARENFKNSTIYALPQIASNPTSALVELANGKADVVFSSKATAQFYIKNNPEKIKLISNKPVQAYSQSLASFHPDDYQMKFLFDTSLRALYASGFIEETIKKYDPNLTTYLPLETPWKE